MLLRLLLPGLHAASFVLSSSVASLMAMNGSFADPAPGTLVAYPDAVREQVESAFADAFDAAAGAAPDAASAVVDDYVRVLGEVASPTVAPDEAHTWRLIAPLYAERVASAGDPDHAAVSLPAGGGSDADTLAAYVGSSQALREARIVVAWLQSLFADQLKPHTMEAAMWRATLSVLRTKPGALAPQGLVKTLDPDAPLRDPDASGLHPDDADLEERLLRHLWLLVKAGKLDEARNVCRKVGQPWRAASLGGGAAFHDAIYAGEVKLTGERIDDAAPAGNVQRLLWRQMVQVLASEASSQYERALYGVLAGSLSAVLPLCTSWEDHLWARCATALTSVLDTHLATARPSANAELVRTGLPAAMDIAQPESAGASQLDMQSMFAALLSEAQSPELRTATRAPFHTIQQLLITAQENAALVTLAGWAVADSAAAVEALDALPGSHAHARAILLRFGASLVLFFRSIEVALSPEAEAAGVALLTGYVEHLIASGQSALIALYTAQLPSSRQVGIYAKFLEGVDDGSARADALRAAEAARLDVRAITSQVVRNIYLASEAEASDERKVHSLQWLCFYPDQRAEALVQANALARSLLLAHVESARFDASLKATPADAVAALLAAVPVAKVEVTRQLLSVVLPADTLDILRDGWAEAELVEAPAREANAVHEFQCLVAYLEVLSAYDEWSNILFERPVPPAEPDSSRYSDKLMYDQEKKAHDEAYELWQQAMGDSTAVVLDLLNATLLFPSGWLKDVVPIDHGRTAGDAARADQLELLRSVCIPSLCFMLHRVLYDTHDFAGSLKVADLVADPHYNLAATFSPAELRQLLRLFRLSSLQLLEAGLDPLGYDK
ncbi:nuclear pore complex protein Nup107 [Thecamonas trahens ATCC 50062]|uniref:Nuclear pore complex protein n=1 Tax=Thecamonas trahens ATCC 50062 TaxID=461836 RepID=A0A0L0DTL8_THETB|nr:nuclear pore complex protein Nup107 [Thecamonas trahens ATCC 50062]KNC55585.1 nuclear pore complex protein Nup107 [Thecamonas trahens ATCC 50062]|eukprot:XP_013761358.1 nuclear pore complex protein Nup107 [Thecamonas trahens ATCC 50062]